MSLRGPGPSLAFWLVYSVGTVPSRTERSARGACGRKNCLASTNDLWACRAARTWRERAPPPGAQSKLQIDAQGYLAPYRGPALEIPGETESLGKSRTPRPTLAFRGALGSLISRLEQCYMSSVSGYPRLPASAHLDERGPRNIDILTCSTSTTSTADSSRPPQEISPAGRSRQ